EHPVFHGLHSRERKSGTSSTLERTFQNVDMFVDYLARPVTNAAELECSRRLASSDHVKGAQNYRVVRRPGTTHESDRVFFETSERKVFKDETPAVSANDHYVVKLVSSIESESANFHIR